MRNVLDKFIENIKTSHLQFFSPENRAVGEIMLKKTHNEFLHFLCNNGYANAPQRDIIRTLRILFKQFFRLPISYVFNAIHDF
jgi:hypothetical protein